MLNLLIEPFKSCGDAKDTLEIFLIIETGIHAWTNIIFARVYMKKIADNVSSAIEDWSCSSAAKESCPIMTGYARIGRAITLSQLVLGSTAAFLYFTVLMVGNKQQVVSKYPIDVLISSFFFFYKKRINRYRLMCVTYFEIRGDLT